MISRLAFAGLCLCATGIFGCATLGSKEPTPEVEQEESEWLGNLKSLKGTGDTLGVSNEAREIEKRLGNL